jgi:alpha-mannosidase
MHAEIRNQNTERIEPFLKRLKQETLAESIPLEARCARSDEPVPFDQRLDGDFVRVETGDEWGRAWDSAWFNLTATVPEDWKGWAVAAQIELNGEALVFDESGCPFYGLSGGSVFIPGYTKDIFMISESCAGGEAVDLWIEAAANNIMGVGGSPQLFETGGGSSYRGRVNMIRLVQYDLDKWHLSLDIEVLASMLNALGDSPRRNRIIKTVCEAIDMMLGKGCTAAECREHLKQLWTPAHASGLKVTGIGHAHIDTGWLWPVKETVRKCARTFASQLALIEKYPDYVFGASQPQHYRFVKEHYPALYEKIKAAVKAGRWEVQGGMWVEADCNIISGESMVRQFIHGKNFFMDEFGEDVRNLWLPDVFGYSAALPQILRKCGVDFFMTQKISWNRFNTFPFHLFNWSGVDGTSVVTHFLPEENYNSMVDAAALIEAQERFNENDRCDEFVSLFGIGDGGGGPTEEMVERGLRMHNLEGCPKWTPGKAHEAFERMRGLSEELATWSGELYLELHRGTLTSQAWVKKCNRRLENRLRAVEFLYSSLPLSQYPAEELDQIWKLVLLNQFHDILPGSSIDLVYQQTHREYNTCLEQCDRLVERATQALFTPGEDALTLVNVLSYDYSFPVILPPAWAGCDVQDENGASVPVQHENGQTVAQVTIPATGSLTLRKGEKTNLAESVPGGLVLENEYVAYTFDENGRLLCGYDKECGRELLAGPANILSLYEDTPLQYDAWDIDIYYEKMEMEQAAAAAPFVSVRGTVRDTLEFELSIGASSIRQTVSLAKNSRRMDFDTTVDWREEHRMLRVAFPTAIQTNECTCDIQYSHVKRPNHRNTSWDMARFEVAAHKYVDLSDNGYGVALLNDCKYGFRILENVIDMNLLRAPKSPDPAADIREHRFTYSLLPHAGALVESDVIAEANRLNHPPVIAEGLAGPALIPPCILEGKGVSLEAVKKAGKEDHLVIRIVETGGRNSTAVLTVADRSAHLVPTNLLEWEDGEALDCADPITLTLRPFEIATFRIKSRGNGSAG